MKKGDTIRFRYNYKIVEGVIEEVIEDPLHATCLKVWYDGRFVRVMPGEVVK